MKNVEYNEFDDKIFDCIDGLLKEEIVELHSTAKALVRLDITALESGDNVAFLDYENNKKDFDWKFSDKELSEVMTVNTFKKYVGDFKGI